MLDVFVLVVQYLLKGYCVVDVLKSCVTVVHYRTSYMDLTSMDIIPKAESTALTIKYDKKEELRQGVFAKHENGQTQMNNQPTQNSKRTESR